MPTYNSLPDFLEDCADAIRSKDGTTARIQGVQIPARIRGIPSGGGSGVESFNGRTGVVVSQSGDYNASQIDTRVAGVNVQQKLDQLENDYRPDAALSLGSSKPVQNKVITAEINALKSQGVPPGGSAGAVLAKRTNSNYATEWISTDNFMRKTTYDTNNNGIVDKAEEALAVKGPVYKATLRNTTADTTLLTEEDRGNFDGVAPLDNTGKIEYQYLPDGLQAGLTLGGTFDASTGVAELTTAGKSALGVTTDTVTLTNDTDPTTGYADHSQLFYITQTAGTFAGINFSEGDWLISTGTKWTTWANAGHVQSVNGLTGAVILNSDRVPQGGNNLYLTAAERSKLAGIEDGATRDLNLIQSATVTTRPDGTDVLTLTNKNGTVTEFEGNSSQDLDDYLKKNGDGSNVYAPYTPATVRQAFTGSETMAAFYAKVSGWLNLLEDVAFTGQWRDIKNAPTKTSQFTNDGNGIANQPFITRVANDLVNYYTKDDTYTRQEIQNLVDSMSRFDYEVVNTLPVSNIDPETIYYVSIPAPGTGYNRYQYIGNAWVFLGSTDVDMSQYLKTDGNGSDVTVSFTEAATRAPLVSGQSLSELFGQVSIYLNELKEVAFTGSWHDLVDASELATQDDLEDYVPIQQELADAGKALVIGDDGKVTPQNVAQGVVRRGTGNYSVIGNDSEESPINTVNGNYSTAFGFHTSAVGNNKFVTGSYNTEDFADLYTEQVGGGSATERADIRTLDKEGRGWYRSGVSVGNTTDNVVVPTNGNDLTTKTYVDTTVETSIASANLLKTMVVTQVPEVEDAQENVLYLIADPTSEDVYFQYKKVLESQNPDVYVMARLGSTQITSSSIQVEVLPAPSLAYENAVYQYIGSGSEYRYGFFYHCKKQGYYAWLNNTDAKYYYTTSAQPRKYDKIYDENLAPITPYVNSVSGATLTDSASKTYTRLAAQDTTQYEWQIVNGNLSDFVNNGTGSGTPDDYFITKKDLLDYLMPIGYIWTTVSKDDPNELYGGTWQLVSSGRYLRGVAATTNAGGTVDEQLPNIKGDYTLELTGNAGQSGAFKWTKNSGNRQPNYTGSNSWGNLSFDASRSSSIYKNNGHVIPNSYTVHFWQRTG